MADVFISYAREDREAAQRIAKVLEVLGYSVWWDREILGGDNFDEVIERELDQAKSIVVLWSRYSVSSNWVRNEASSAAERGALVPAFIENVRPPLEFRRRHTIDLTKWRGEENDAEFIQVLRAIEAQVGRAPSRNHLRASNQENKSRISLPQFPINLGRATRAVVVVALIASLFAATLVPYIGTTQLLGMDISGLNKPSVRWFFIVVPPAAWIILLMPAFRASRRPKFYCFSLMLGVEILLITTHGVRHYLYPKLEYEVPNSHLIAAAVWEDGVRKFSYYLSPIVIDRSLPNRKIRLDEMKITGICKVTIKRLACGFDWALYIGPITTKIPLGQQQVQREYNIPDPAYVSSQAFFHTVLQFSDSRSEAADTEVIVEQPCGFSYKYDGDSYQAWPIKPATPDAPQPQRLIETDQNGLALYLAGWSGWGAACKVDMSNVKVQLKGRTLLSE